MEEHPGNNLSNNTQWKATVRTGVQAIVEPDELAWMEDDDSPSDAQYIARALQDIEARYGRPLYNPAAQGREQLAIQLGNLACVLVHAHTDDCSVSSEMPSIDTISAFVAVANHLLDGPDEEVTARVRKAVFDSLAKTLRHHTSGFGGGRLERVSELILHGMKDADRTARLRAGQSLLELVKLYQRIGNGASKRTEPLFNKLYRLFEHANDRVKETTIITLGRIGLIATGEVLGQDVCCLIAQLGQPSPILKGTTHMQLQTLAKHHNKTLYNVVSPYMDQVAPYLVSRLYTQPNLLVETCRLFAVSPVDFLSITLHRTMPQLFATRNVKVLDTISRELDESTSQLFMKHSHHILAYVFRLPAPGETNKALSFILDMLRTSAQRDIDITSVIRSCIVPLLAELVVVMGDEDPDQVDTFQAKQGLFKVVKILRQSREASPQKIGAFLEEYMLGIISHLNDLLQDVYGKRSLDRKKAIICSMGRFVAEVGTAVSNVAPQIMATLQTTLVIPQLADVTLQSWYTFLTTLDTSDLGPYVGPTSASFVAYWPTFSMQGREIAKQCLDFIVSDKGAQLGRYLDEVVEFGLIPQLSTTYQVLLASRSTWSAREKFRRTLERALSESHTVSIQSLCELKSLMLENDEELIRALTSGDVFDPLASQLLTTLLSVACRDGEDTESLRMLAFDCIGILGAIDPDRLEINTHRSRNVMLSNFTDESESVSFALHLIRDVLVGAFRSTSDIKYQSHLAYAIQELLQFCKFTPALVNPTSTGSIPLKVRNRWNSLPKHVLETITPLLDSKFTLDPRAPVQVEHPVYKTRKSYREWVQTWTSDLLTRTSGDRARDIFRVFTAVVHNKDVGVAHHLLPHLVLNVLVSGSEEDAQHIRNEFLEVLRDQVEPSSQSTPDKKLLSAQTVFMLLDHLNQWVQAVRQELSSTKPENKRTRANVALNEAEEQLLKIDSILSSIDSALMAKAAFQCKAYARSLVNYERQILTLQAGDVQHAALQDHLERLHEIYAHLDEPDGMEGVSTFILSPSLEHQIRQHESIGRWTSAQSCWEVRLQHSPDNLDFHLGLLRCLRNLGHYDTLRTHVKGVLTRNPGWQSELVGFQVESEWMMGNWNDVRTLIENTTSEAAPVLLAQVLLAFRNGDASDISTALSAARKVLGTPIVAAGAGGYRRSYDAVLNLHLLHELEAIHSAIGGLFADGQQSINAGNALERLSRCLDARLESTLPTFRTQEPILSMRRMVFGLSGSGNRNIDNVVGEAWLASAKIARKAGHQQTAFSAILQAQQCKVPYSFTESAKLTKAGGEPLRALQELENYMRLLGILEDGTNVIDLTQDIDDPKLKAKTHVLRARWMNDSDRYDISYVLKAYKRGSDLWPKWESGQFHVGRFHDECFKTLSPADQQDRGTRMNLQTVKAFAKAIRYGSKYIYQTVPRLLTLWLDMGENSVISTGNIFPRINDEVAKAIKSVPVYKARLLKDDWYTAFPQIVSRVGHGNESVHVVLSRLISMVIQEYPRQALWLFVSVVKSTKPQRASRGKSILDLLRAHNRDNVATLINESLKMSEELLVLTNRPVRDDKKTMSMAKDAPALLRLAPSQLIIPIQESLIASLPPTSSSDANYQPFPINAPTFARFQDEIDIMRSLARPRKITIHGSNGQIYMFLGKPKDDLRKDARLMDFNAIINKLLKSKSESRRRQLHIRTYGVVTLNEECGFIQWVPNTVPIRFILTKLYDRRGTKSWSNELQATAAEIKGKTVDKEAAQVFQDKILARFPPVFHEWLIETFPEPTAWLTSRLAYSRTAAVMSMVGFILGQVTFISLGDRHGENILLDTNNGDVVHVDFNCLFEKGKTLEIPELVPFRLTQNIVDGLGVTGTEGVFRIACEVTMQLLRDNKDTLMSVLDAFIHDPLVEWEDEKRKREHSRSNISRSTVDLRKMAMDALRPIEKKLNGIYTTSRERPEKETSTSSLVEMLIREATDNTKLCRMYVGWTPWH
ncbi:uncharacterized protein LAESUDRAFT_655532 [Laetiporus sulphureus 93-53]|uniref:non-specific serine/threonine protein kinase n=1 Tax=Laetiporus sulphureus 93-53 TaxID=1314785 RepID=A0A165DT51_9APHY|nr:uncharacterized protein LAESUDRAFT_655532 [Laetiporus sulphureus 93-53]KZT05577.1 hypothetical protein LAESUDRAFT_655532 [Laetiporus sulphureus 93-53]